MLPIDPDILHTEVTQIRNLINQLVETIERGIPGDDAPSTSENQEIWQVRMRQALMLAGARLIAIAEVIEA